MNDYQRGMMRAAEICEERAAFFGEATDEELHSLHKRERESYVDCATAIRAEAEKVAEAPTLLDVQAAIEEGDIQRARSLFNRGVQMNFGNAAPSAPDEALIEEIADRKADQYLNWNNPLPLGTIIVLAIHEYIDLKRRGNRLGALPESKCVTYGDKTHESSN